MEENKSVAMKIVTPVVALIIGAIIGFIIGAVQTESLNPEVARLQKQVDDAKKFFPTMPEMRSVSGKILSLSGNTITIESMASINPFETLPSERVVTITANTKLVSMEQKNQTILQKEMEEFSKKMSSLEPGNITQREPVTPPMPFNEKTLTLSDLSEGDMVNVEADENIKEKVSFTATKITITSVPLMLTPPVM